MGEIKGLGSKQGGKTEEAPGLTKLWLREVLTGHS